MTYRRNIFAKIRTLMANERTLMSYYRTALGLIGLGGFIFKFYKSLIFQILAGFFALIGVVLAGYGTWRYFRFIKRIKKR